MQNQYAMMGSYAPSPATYGNMYQSPHAHTSSYSMPQQPQQQQQPQQPTHMPSQSGYVHQIAPVSQQSQPPPQQSSPYINPATQTHHIPSHHYHPQQQQHQQQPPPPPPQQQQQQQSAHDSLFARATARAGRQRERATTMEQQQAGIPPSIQRVASRLDPNAPIRLQPSPAYYPPPADAYGQDLVGVGGGGMGISGANRRRSDRAGSRVGASGMGGGGMGQGGNGGQSRDFIRNLEDGAMGSGWGGQWHG